jgi:hypothetical protein
MKPAAFQATPQLGPEASRELLKRLGGVHLTDKRRKQLADMASAARAAFARPLPTAANGR